MYSEDVFRADPYAVRCFVERALDKEQRMQLMKLREGHTMWCAQSFEAFNKMNLPPSVQRLFSLNDIAPSSKPGASLWQSLRMHNTSFYTSDLCDSDAWNELTLYAVLQNTWLAEECNGVLEYATDEYETCEHTFLLDDEVRKALGYVYTEVLLKVSAGITKETRLLRETPYNVTLPNLLAQEKDESMTIAKTILFLFVQTLQVLIEELREQDDTVRQFSFSHSFSVQEVPVLGQNGLLHHVMSTVIANIASKLPTDTLLTITEEWSYLGFFITHKSLDPCKIAELAYNAAKPSEEDERTPFTDDSERWPTSYLLTFETGDAKPQTVTLDHDSTITVCAGETRLTVTVKKGAKHDD